MRFTKVFLSAAVLLIVSVAAHGYPSQIDVDCSIEGELRRALDAAAKAGGADLHLSGVCEGGVVISTDGVTLRGVTADAGLVPPDPPDGTQALVEVVGAQVSLRHLTLAGGVVGAWGKRSGTDLLLFDCDLVGQEVGAYAERGAGLRLIDSTVRDTDVGLLVSDGASLNLNNVTVTGNATAIALANRSHAAINDTTVENNGAGLTLEGRCDAGVVGGSFRENGELHFFAGGRSEITLQSPVVGSDTDSTQVALGVNEDSKITSYNTPLIYGNVYALDNGSLRIGNTTLEGSVELAIFSDAYISNTEVTGGIFCKSGSDAACTTNVTTPGVFGCPSTSCGVEPR